MDFLKKTEYTDIEILAGDTTFFFNRYVLTISSEYFVTLLKWNTNKSVRLEKSPKCINSLFNVMLGKIVYSVDQLNELIDCLHEYMMPHLEIILANDIISRMRNDTSIPIISIINVAIKYNILLLIEYFTNRLNSILDNNKNAYIFINQLFGVSEYDGDPLILKWNLYPKIIIEIAKNLLARTKDTNVVDAIIGNIDAAVFYELTNPDKIYHIIYLLNLLSKATHSKDTSLKYLSMLTKLSEPKKK